MEQAVQVVLLAHPEHPDQAAFKVLSAQVGRVAQVELQVQPAYQAQPVEAEVAVSEQPPSSGLRKLSLLHQDICQLLTLTL